MDSFFPPTSTEALAHGQLTDNWFEWHSVNPSLEETLIAGCASYSAFAQYLSGKDQIYVMPGSKQALKQLLNSFAQVSIHNSVAKRRGDPLQAGGYSRTCRLAEQSVARVLNEHDNVSYLLNLHAPKPVETIHGDRPQSRSIRSL